MRSMAALHTASVVISRPSLLCNKTQRLLPLKNVRRNGQQYRMVSLLNSLTQRLEPLPQDNGKVTTWYSCGPTLYDHAHLGHARNYVTQDILYRVLVHYFQRDIHFVLGLTDVDDKIVKVAEQQSTSFLHVAREFEHEFIQDLTQLNVLPPAAYVRVSEHIPDIIAYIEKILQHGFAYVSPVDQSVYFNTEAFEQYGYRYGQLDPNHKRAAIAQEIEIMDANKSPTDEDATIQEEEGHVKKNSRDFALWKTSSTSTNEEQEVAGWTSPWGFGRPGWHIECSAMCHRVFGTKLDLHSGGIDLQFPHHNNEIAQCEAFAHALADPKNASTTSTSWCNHFLHFGHLHIQGLKMSKSLKNFITIQDFLQTYSADQFRFFCLQHHYRSNLHYSTDRMDDAKAVGSKFESFFIDLIAYRRLLFNSRMMGKNAARDWTREELELNVRFRDAKTSVHNAFVRDVDTPVVLQSLMQIISETNGYLHRGDPAQLRFDLVESVGAYVVQMLDLLGFIDIVPAEFRVGHRRVRGTKEHTQNQDNQDLIDTFVQWRARIRKQVLSGSSFKEHQHGLLQACDDIRKTLMDQHSIQIDDITTEQSIWKFMNDDDRETTTIMTEEKSKVDKSRPHLLPLDQVIAISPATLFQEHPAYSGRYSQYDDDGIPTHDQAGAEVTKTARKKLRKKLDKHRKLIDSHGVIEYP